MIEIVFELIGAVFEVFVWKAIYQPSQSKTPTPKNGIGLV